MKLSAALLALVLSAPMGMAAPQDGEQLTKTELSTAQATAAAAMDSPVPAAASPPQGDPMEADAGLRTTIAKRAKNHQLSGSVG